MSKRGQITIFVILGLVVFIIVFIAFFLLNRSLDIDPEKEYEQDYDVRLQPIVDNVRQCLSDLSKEVFEEIGLQGGYSNISRTTHGFDREYLNTGLEIFPDSGLVVPYWLYYDGAPRDENANLVINMPPLTGNSPISIASQVENHIENNILSCVNYFEGYPDFIIEYEEPSATIMFRPEDVFIGLDYKILVEFPNGLEAEISKFSNNIDLEFRKIYELARSIAIQTQFLDEKPFLDSSVKLIINLMSLGGKDALIPPMNPTFEPGTSVFVMWTKTQVKEEIQRVIQETAPYFQILNSKDSFIPMTHNPYLNDVYSDFQFPLIFDDKETLHRTKIRFNYFETWPMFLDINPSSGELIKPIRDSLHMDLPFFGDMGMTRFEYSYDLVFPVLITLEEEVSYDGEGYVFQFPVTVNIERNNPRTSLNESDELPSLDLEADDVSGFGEFDQRTVPINLKIINAYTREPIRGLSLLYSCGSKGTYLEPLSSEENEIKTLVPPCVGGVISSDEAGYFVKPYTGNFLVDEEEKEVIVEAYPEKEISVSARTLRFNAPTMTSDEIEKFELEDERAWEVGVSEDLTQHPFDDELVLVVLERIQGPNEPSFIQVAELKGPDFLGKIRLIPGDYEVVVVSSLELEEPFVVENRTYELKEDYDWVDGVLQLSIIYEELSDEEKVELDEIVFNESLVLGFMELRNEKSFSVSGQELGAMNNLLFVYPSFNYEELIFHQDMVVYSLIENATNSHPEQFGVRI